MKIKILEANLHNSPVATLEAFKFITDYCIDLALIQEPYCFHNENSFTTTHMGKLQLVVVQDTTFDSCIIINNIQMQIINRVKIYKTILNHCKLLFTAFKEKK